MLCICSSRILITEKLVVGFRGRSASFACDIPRRRREVFGRRASFALMDTSDLRLVLYTPLPEECTGEKMRSLLREKRSS
jgi:hypothetical protein